jgi:prophage tail gpP-like protein
VTAPDVSILIEGVEFTNWTEFELSLGLDSYSAAGFTAPFEPDREEFRELFRPFSFKECQVFIDDNLMFTGRLVDIVPEVTAESASIQVTAYSKPNELFQVTPPPTLLPLEFNGMTLVQIAQKLAEPFGIGVRADAPIDAAVRSSKLKQQRRRRGAPRVTPVGDKFDRAQCDPDKKIQEFLVDLAQQRGLVITDDPQGNLVFQQSVAPGNPVAVLEGQPLTRVTPAFSPESYYSELTGFGSKRSGKGTAKWTEENKRYLGTNLRPLSFILDDTESGDVPYAVRARLGRMHGEIVSYVVDNLPTWTDPENYLWHPNTTLMLRAPEAMVYNYSELLVRNVALRVNEASFSASLGLCLPGAFSATPAEIPERMPWEG